MWEEVDSDLSQAYAFLQGQDKCLTLNMAHAQVAQRLVGNTSPNLRTPVTFQSRLVISCNVVDKHAY